MALFKKILFATSLLLLSNFPLHMALKLWTFYFDRGAYIKIAESAMVRYYKSLCQNNVKYSRANMVIKMENNNDMDGYIDATSIKTEKHETHQILSEATHLKNFNCRLNMKRFPFKLECWHKSDASNKCLMYRDCHFYYSSHEGECNYNCIGVRGATWDNIDLTLYISRNGKCSIETAEYASATTKTAPPSPTIKTTTTAPPSPPATTTTSMTTTTTTASTTTTTTKVATAGAVTTTTRTIFTKTPRRRETTAQKPMPLTNPSLNSLSPVEKMMITSHTTSAKPMTSQELISTEAEPTSVRQQFVSPGFVKTSGASVNSLKPAMKSSSMVHKMKEIRGFNTSSTDDASPGNILSQYLITLLSSKHKTESRVPENNSPNIQQKNPQSVNRNVTKTMSAQWFLNVWLYGLIATALGFMISFILLILSKSYVRVTRKTSRNRYPKDDDTQASSNPS